MSSCMGSSAGQAGRGSVGGEEPFEAPGVVRLLEGDELPHLVVLAAARGEQAGRAGQAVVRQVDQRIRMRYEDLVGIHAAVLVARRREQDVEFGGDGLRGHGRPL